MILSGVSMVFMMSLDEINYFGLVSAGLIMGMSFGFYWANRDYLVIATTTDRARNFYYGFETFTYTLTAAIVPVIIGWYLVNDALGKLPAAAASVALVGQLLVVTILGIFILHEIPTILQIIGGIACLIGIIIVQCSFKKTGN